MQMQQSDKANLNWINETQLGVHACESYKFCGRYSKALKECKYFLYILYMYIHIIYV